MKKLLKFMQMPLKWKILLLEAFFFLAISRFLIWRFQLKTFAHILGKENRETKNTDEGINTKKVRAIGRAIEIMSQHTPWQSKCFTKVCAAKFMLKRRNFTSTVYFGLAKDGQGKMIAHAWIRCGSIFVTGGEGGKNFTITNRFA